MEPETEPSLLSDKELPFPENAADFSSVDKGDVSPSFLMHRLVSELECSLASQPHSLTRRGSGRLGTQSLSPRNVCCTSSLNMGRCPTIIVHKLDQPDPLLFNLAR